MDLQQRSTPPDIRERLIQAGYELLTQRGSSGSGVDLIADKADCAKATLYKIFGSKAALTIAVLQRREDLWTRDWLEMGVMSRANDAEGRLLAVFDMFRDWFRRDDFEGCAFMKILLEPTIDTEIRAAALRHTANIRFIITELAEEARLQDVDCFADAWLMIMDGSILAACQGNSEAASVAMRMAEPLLDTWPRRTCGGPADIHDEGKV